jgi:hypothetical protein
MACNSGVVWNDTTSASRPNYTCKIIIQGDSMSFSAKRKRLREHIRETFADIEYPGDDNLVFSATDMEA